ncbi:SF1B family DNA helicase RecD2 [Spiroplasma taiwanense]|uniref:Exodeoxyribonuclease V subunit alpha n=1 Tax=Spiroplasma taiwanense CT-1 TaxID=1276220 RepID=S5LTT2_9MOLU|nr:AAA family ATPase [Spiroplasma taiwanense]AGR41124.1 exodeoxyribonuclease V subunit alpha [Spiroplasma taiwanense CT-1]
MKTYKGKINKFLFKGSNGYGVALFTLFENSKKALIIVGTISTMESEVIYEITGTEVEDFKRKQVNFSVTSFKQTKSFDKEGLIKYLSSPLFPTVGKKLAEQIVEKFSENIFEEVLENKQLLLEVSGMTEAKAEIIYDVIEKNFSDKNILNIFIQNNLKIEFWNELKNEIKDENLIEDILKTSFYQYAYDHKFFPFEEVDKVALQFGQNIKGEERVAWYSHEIVKKILFSTGNTYTNFINLYKEFSLKLPLNISQVEFEQFLVYAKTQKILYFKDKKIYTKESFEDEVYIAKELANLKKRSSFINNDFDFDNLLQIVQEFFSNKMNKPDFKYNVEQIEAIKNFVNNGVSIVTGGPGTGKTTVIAAIVKMYELIFKNAEFAITAPTGRAAGKIKDDSGYKTSTIHRLLQYTGNDNFEANETKPIYKDLVIIDECSMIDNHLFASLLKGIKGIKKIVLVGDVEQLPSVSYGNLFEDLINCSEFSTTKLKINNRQKESDGGENLIIKLANVVRDEEIENFDFINSSNVNFLFNSESMELLKKLKTNYLNLNPNSLQEQLTDIQVIAPMYKEQLGITNLNKILQGIVNPNNLNSYKRFDYEFRYNDKVMYTENDPFLELSNGDVGFINKFEYLNNKLREAVLTFSERKIEMGLKAFNNVTLNYVCSIHKTQGSEYKNVFIVLDNSNRTTNFFVNKKMIYTAITRAKEKLFILSDKQTFINACLKQSIQRETTLKNFIIEEFKNYL